MKAAQFSRFGGPEVLEIVELPDPHPGPGEIRIAVHAAGVNASDWKKREGLMDQELPQTLGYEAAGVVDELGEGVNNVAVGDRVFGASPYGAAQAELAVLSDYAPVPASLDFAAAAALPAAVETAARALDQLHVAGGSTVLINGASGSVGRAAVQFAVVRGARVIGTGSPATHEDLRSLGAEPVAYGDGMPERVRALAPAGVDLALDAAGSGVLPELIELANGNEHVITVADFAGAERYGVRFSSGDSGRASYALRQVGDLIDSGRFSLPVGETFPLADIARAHRVGEAGRVRGKLVLLLN
jgi:NADPH:quinone reductase-like Zn-dependent oxidoreductase